MHIRGSVGVIKRMGAPDTNDSVLIVTGAVIVSGIAVTLLLTQHRKRATKLIDRWSAANGLKILSRKRDFLPLPSGMLATRGGDQIYRVSAERSDGLLVNGWIRCNVGYSGRTAGRVDAKWEESRGFPVVFDQPNNPD